MLSNEGSFIFNHFFSSTKSHLTYVLFPKRGAQNIRACKSFSISHSKMEWLPKRAEGKSTAKYLESKSLIVLLVLSLRSNTHNAIRSSNDVML